MTKQEISQKIISLSCDLLNNFLTKEQASDILYKMAEEIYNHDLCEYCEYPQSQCECIKA